MTRVSLGVLSARRPGAMSPLAAFDKPEHEPMLDTLSPPLTPLPSMKVPAMPQAPAPLRVGAESECKNSDSSERRLGPAWPTVPAVLLPPPPPPTPPPPTCSDRPSFPLSWCADVGPGRAKIEKDATISGFQEHRGRGWRRDAPRAGATRAHPLALHTLKYTRAHLPALDNARHNHGAPSPDRRSQQFLLLQYGALRQ